MSHKIAKRIRKLLKVDGVDVRHALYNLQTHTHADGTKSNTVVLSDNCGRKLYKKAKKAFANV